MREHVCPLFRFGATRGMCVDDAVFEDDGASTSRTQVVLLSNDVGTVVQRRKEGMSSDDCRAIVERARGGIDRILFFTAPSRHAPASIRLPLDQAGKIAYDFDEE